MRVACAGLGSDVNSGTAASLSATFEAAMTLAGGEIFVLMRRVDYGW